MGKTFTIKTLTGLKKEDMLGKPVKVLGKDDGKIIDYNTETGEMKAEFVGDFDIPSQTIFISSRAIENGREQKLEAIKVQLDVLSDEDRLELFSNYCRHCGTSELGCQCWNDE